MGEVIFGSYCMHHVTQVMSDDVMLHCEVRSKTLKIPEWLVISNTSKVSHTHQSIGKLVFQRFGSIQLLSSFSSFPDDGSFMWPEMLERQFPSG